MHKSLWCTLVIIAIFAAGTLPLMAQQKEKQKRKRVSPHEKISLSFDKKDITIEYGRPYTKHPKSGEVRKIWGALVPYGKVWRLGADEATVLTTKLPIKFGKTTLQPGSYTLFMLPKEGDDPSKLIINRKLGQWGAYAYNPKDDIAQIDLKKDDLDKSVDQFTLVLEKAGPKDGVLRIQWEKTEYSVPFAVQGDEG